MPMLAIVLALVTVWIADAPRWFAPLTPAEAVAGGELELCSRLLASAPGAVAGAATALLLALMRSLRRRAGAFGCVMAAVLAAAAAAAAAPWLGAWAAASGLAATLLAPWLRERGLVSLLLVTLLAAAPLIHARRASIAVRSDAEAFAQLRDPILGSGLARLVVAIPDELPLQRRRALVRSLLPPCTEEPLQVWLVADPLLAQELHAGGFALLDMRGKELHLLPPPGEPAVAELRDAAIRWIRERGPVALLRPPQGRYQLRVVAPWRGWSAEGTDPERGLQLEPNDRESLLADLAELGPAARVLAHVQALPAGLGSGWLSLGSEP